MVQEVKGGYNDFDWTNAAAALDGRHAASTIFRA